MNVTDKLTVTRETFADLTPLRHPPKHGKRCPKCLGFRMWNLVLDFFEPGRHLRSTCGKCGGTGWVPAHDPDKVEDFHTHRHAALAGADHHLVHRHGR